MISHLSQDYIREGYLHKTGPSPTDVYKKRWCTLGGRKLMYHVEPLDAYAKVGLVWVQDAQCRGHLNQMVGCRGIK